jgi:DNA-binding HxlR family transcriptional regulator
VEYGQFCPIAKASEIIGEKWTVLIQREILMGSRRFSELQRGLGTISPTLLSRRLRHLEKNRMIFRKTATGQRGHEYHPTESCKELLPVLLSLGEWGMRWARSNLQAHDYDVELLMLYLQRSVVPEKLPQGETIIRFKFTDMTDKVDWWIIVADGEAETCDKDPGKDVDIYLTTTVATMADLWMGKESWRMARRDGRMSIIGNRYLVENVTVWMENSIFTGLPSAENIM